MTREQAAERDRDARRWIAQRADEWRAIARAVPFWEIDRSGDEIVVRERGGQPMATLHGGWASAMADFLQTMNTVSGTALAELLWRIGGHGGSHDIRTEAERLIKYMRLDEVRRERHESDQ
ncbi:MULTISPECIES: hypothetical protein [Prauserella salsuginis group]|uniref:Uncharacterized protein n=1 Tax=Prauserella salsuginis TaxID=387889 RepID=A0ABW6G5R3_9PSEU|nr:MULTISPECIES: hypothetical protein [Prauserella salsuginis group]MCR3719121.1 hypothetical protein [Prauserella flava]MCR3735866.1 hypothetical protein [Prauserella salsuginis]